jgi:imidazolonepropionase
LAEGLLADMIGFPTNDYREILYHQGKLKPQLIWKRGKSFAQPAAANLLHSSL